MNLGDWYIRGRYLIVPALALALTLSTLDAAWFPRQTIANNLRPMTWDEWGALLRLIVWSGVALAVLHWWTTP